MPIYDKAEVLQLICLFNVRVDQRQLLIVIITLDKYNKSDALKQ